MSEREIAIVTDSGASLPESFRKNSYDGTGPVEVPFTIDVYDGQEQIDSWVDHPQTKDERLNFIKVLDNRHLDVKTTQPSAGMYAQAFTDILNKNVTEIAVFPLSGKLSGSVKAAESAASMFGNEAKIQVHDCRTASVGLGLIVRQVDEENRLNKFKNAETLIERADELTRRLIAVQAFSDLDRLHRGGRIGRASSLFGTLLKVIPLIEVGEDGVLDAVGKKRGWDNARQGLIDRVSDVIGSDEARLSVVHFSSNQVDSILEDVGDNFRLAKDYQGQEYDITVCEQSTVISVYSGTGVIGLGALALTKI